MIWSMVMLWAVTGCLLLSSSSSKQDLADASSLPEKVLFWAVKLNEALPDNGLDEEADHIADEFGLVNLGQVGELKGHYLFSFLPVHRSVPVSSKKEFKWRRNMSMSDLNDIHKQIVSPEEHEVHSSVIADKLSQHGLVEWTDQQIVKSRKKRSTLVFSDPQFERQWHLVNHKEHDMDVNITGVWERNVTGEGATVAIVDDGLEWTNPDILPNYSAEGSWDLNAEDDDPMPSGSKIQNHHGTRCAGEVAAAANKFCGVGVAYGAKVAGLRVLDGPMTDSLEATAFTKNMQINDVYSCSWGPDDDGKTVDGPHILAKKAMRYGIDFGRQGYGSIYVVASGNGGEHKDNCNYDGYANSIYTITIGAVDETGRMPYYGEECASMLAVTFSSGGHGLRSIVTTDWRKDAGTGCTAGHTGTSAAAPIAAGLIALMLQVRHCLSWRDVQYLIVLTALKVDINIGKWQKNGIGLHHSPEHGFGLMKAWRLVNAAKVWESVPWMTSFTSEELKPEALIPNNNKTPLDLTYTVTEAMLLGYGLRTLEQVQVIVTLTHWRRGNLEIRLYSPSGTVSIMGARRPNDQSGDGLTGWMFSTVRCWGEEPVGKWRLVVRDSSNPTSPLGTFRSWQLRLFGSSMTSEELQKRRRLIEEAMSGQYLNGSYELACPPPSVNPLPEKPPLSEKTLKILLLSGAFCLMMAIYETMEYAMCYNEEKKEHKKKWLSAQAHTLARQHNGVTYHQIPGEQDTAIAMESEDIAMETLSDPLLVTEDARTEDVLFSAANIHLPTSQNAGNLQDLDNIPKEILDSLSPEEVQLNLNYNLTKCKEKDKSSLSSSSDSLNLGENDSSDDLVNSDPTVSLLSTDSVKR